ncbi:hypothetical protein [Stenotrophomonas acidaminiphila]|uniref:hypothetical protein n=1 Tax=Stenotrophomonas acidaminiphila TaxID=128780 RepID=UPI0028AE0033|nr:hypothetical protein [Stenotrophomonas acidaminiphila]
MKAIKVDMSNPEAAAVGVSEIVGDIVKTVAEGLNESERVVFFATLSARAVGGLAATLGVDATMTVLKANQLGLQKAAPLMEVTAAAARRGRH